MGLKVLVVEDEGIIAMLLEDMLIELGHENGLRISISRTRPAILFRALSASHS